MDARTAIRQGIDTAQFVAMGYLADLSDDDLLRRPHPQCNHIKWQLGHLIKSEHGLIEAAVPGSMPPLPAGFAERYTNDTAGSNDPARFDSKAELLRLFEQQRSATLAALARTSDADLDRPSPEEFRSYAPNVAELFNLQASHWLMHAGQWAVLRRQMGKPPLF